MKAQLTIRDLFWLVLVVATGCGWWLEHRNIARRELTFEIRDPANLADPVLVRLNIDRLSDYNLCKKDVMNAVTPSRFIPADEPRPPPDVVFSLGLPPKGIQQYGDIIVKCDEEGNIVRLKNVANLEFAPSHLSYVEAMPTNPFESP
jgi:hypothetical protein